MRGYLALGLVCGLAACTAFAAEDVATAVVATVKTVDKGTKTVVVKTADGVEHSFHFVDASCTTRSRAPTRPLKKSTTSARTA